MDRLALLRRYGYLKGFTQKTIEKLCKNLIIEEVSHQGLLYKQGDPFTHFYLFVLGEYDQIWQEQDVKTSAEAIPGGT